MAGCMTQYCVDTSVRRTVSLGYDVTLAEDGHLKQTPSLLRSIRSLLITRYCWMVSMQGNIRCAWNRSSRFCGNPSMQDVALAWGAPSAPGLLSWAPGK